MTAHPTQRTAPDPTSRNNCPPQQQYDGPCEACGKYGHHPANRCDMLGMALFLTQYTQSLDNYTMVQEAEQRWIERNKKHLPRDDCTPLTILANYCAEMQFTEDQADSEFDWAYLHDTSPTEDSK